MPPASNGSRRHLFFMCEAALARYSAAAAGVAHFGGMSSANERFFRRKLAKEKKKFSN